MSVLVVGISHRSAPVSVLEKLALDSSGSSKLAAAVMENSHVTEAAVLATCNRCEVYAEVDRFHGSVESITRMLGDVAGRPAEELAPHLYVHFEDAAVAHLFQVATGLDSMVVGEGQILGQARETLRLGQESGHVGPTLNSLFQQALRVGKRSHAETGIDRLAPSVVSAALARAEISDYTRCKAVLVGAGAMSGLAAATLRRAGIGDLVIANRTHASAEHLAELHGGRAVPLDGIDAELGDADLLISCTGATGVVIEADRLSVVRREAAQPLAVLDLALPHDVEPAVADLPGVSLVALATLAGELGGAEHPEVAGVRAIVAEELAAFLSARNAAAVTPTVVALRTMATGVVEAELERLSSRLPGLDATTRAEVEQAVRRVADKLLHQPTVRIKELAGEGETVSYATALAELFSLDPEAVAAVSRVEGV